MFDDAAYVLTVGSVDFDGAIMRMPKRADELKALVMGEAGFRNRGNTSIFASLNPRNLFGANAGLGDLDPQDTMAASQRGIEFVEAYIRVPSSPELAMMDLKDEGAKKEKEQEEKINPSRIHVVQVVGGKFVSYNEPLPFNHGMMPFVSSQSRHWPERIWGFSDGLAVEADTQELARMADRRASYIDLSYMPYLKNPTDSGVENNAFIQRPDSILNPHTGQSGQGIDFLSPPPLGRHIQFRREELLSNIENVLGTFSLDLEAVRRNIKPTLAAQVREVGELPIRMKMERMRPADRKLAIMSVSMWQQFFPDDAKRSVLTDEGEDETIVISRNEIREIKDIEEKFDIRVGITSETPLSKVLRQQQIIEIMQAWPKDTPLPHEMLEALLEASNFPGNRKIIGSCNSPWIWLSECAVSRFVFQIPVNHDRNTSDRNCVYTKLSLTFTKGTVKYSLVISFRFKRTITIKA